MDIRQTILMVKNKTDEKFLRKKTENFDFQKFSKQEIEELVRTMKKMMFEANGIGLSANQVGLPFKMFVAQVPDAHGNPKFYAVFNPVILKISDDEVLLEEGCLSVPGLSGKVKRKERLTLGGFDKNGKPLKIKAWGLLAHVFQHETDHLNGMLFIDKADETYSSVPEENE